MTRLALLTLALAGCDKLFDLDRLPARHDSGGGGGDDATDGMVPDDVVRIDAPDCTTVGHDEDSDMREDTCDACPTFTSDLMDFDMDGLPDACDRNNAPTMRDKIIAYWPFASSGELADFMPSVSGIAHIAANKGYVSMIGPASLTAIDTYQHTRIELHVANLQATNGPLSQLHIEINGTAVCVVQGARCDNTSGLCVTIPGTTSFGNLSAGPSVLTRVALFRSGTNVTKCEMVAGAGTESSKSEALPGGLVAISLTQNTQIELRALVIYGVAP